MAIARDFTITYGSFTVGGNGTSVARPIDGALGVQSTPDENTFTFSFWVFGTTPALFASNCTAAEDAFRTPYQDLQITVGDTSTNADWFNYSHADGSGFDAKPSFVKNPTQEGASGLSRRYDVTITVQLPANQLGSSDGQMGRRETSVSIKKAQQNRITLRITGSYTAVTTANNSGGQTGRDQYESAIGAYVAAVQASVGATIAWDKVSETLTFEDGSANIGEGKVCEFEREYVEILTSQSIATLNDADLIDQNFEVRWSRYARQLADHSTVNQTDRAIVSYSVYLAKEDANGNALTGLALKTKWQSTIRPLIIQQLQTIFQTRATTVLQEDVNYNFDENKIVANMELGGLVGETRYAEISVADSITGGRVLVPVWTADPFAYYSYQGPQKRTRVITISIMRETGTSAGNPLPRSSITHPNGGVVVDRSIEAIPFRPMQDPPLAALSWGVRQIREVITIEYFSEPGQPREVGEDAENIDTILR